MAQSVLNISIISCCFKCFWRKSTVFGLENLLEFLNFLFSFLQRIVWMLFYIRLQEPNIFFTVQMPNRLIKMNFLKWRSIWDGEKSFILSSMLYQTINVTSLANVIIFFENKNQFINWFFFNSCIQQQLLFSLLDPLVGLGHAFHGQPRSKF